MIAAALVLSLLSIGVSGANIVYVVRIIRNLP